MKKKISDFSTFDCLTFRFALIVLFMQVIALGQAKAQSAWHPSCNSNAYGWSIEKISTSGQSTFVDLKFYRGERETFWINPGTYIENPYSPGKYYIRNFVNNQLGEKYTLNSNTEYYITLEFERIPASWKSINIIEPSSPGNTSWYWKNISLYDLLIPHPKNESFLTQKGIGTIGKFAHPFNTFSSSRYCMDNNKIWVDIIYKESHIELTMEKNGDIFERMQIVTDTDFFPPFLSLQLLREIILEQLRAQKYISEFEKALHKTFEEMTGLELQCLLLTILWNVYK